MFNTSLYYRSISRLILMKRFFPLKPDGDVGAQIKSFNAKKQFKKTLELFDKHKENDVENLSSFIITQALKACAEVHDLQRGLIIHRLISTRITTDCYLSASLIHLYTPDQVIIILLFNACAKLESSEALNLAKKISKEIPKSFFSNPRLSTSLLDALMKCGDVNSAESLFDNSKEKSLPTYAVMMKGYIKNNMAIKAIDIFNKIQAPDEVIIILLFNACAQLETPDALNLAKKVSKEIPKSFFSNRNLSTSLLDALMKCGDVKYAQTLFDALTVKVSSMYAAMMNGFNKENKPSEVLNLFNRMKVDGIGSDIVIYLCVIKALSHLGDYSLIEVIVKQIPNSYLADNHIQTALIDMWGKIGCCDEAEKIFEKIRQPNEIEYSTMINAYGLNGRGTQAIELYHQMPHEFINEVTYICVLNACSHSGLVNEARLIFKNIEIKTERIYSTMVDCLSRAFYFEEAEELIDEYECHHSPVSAMYMALLSSARNIKNSCLSQKVYHRMKKIFPDLKNELTSATVLLANVYASSGEIDKSSDIRIELNKSGSKKKIGISSTVVNGWSYDFRAHERSHPRTADIYAEVEKMSKELIAHGHQYDASWITRPLDSDETVETALCGHSEKLAIAWHFIDNREPSRIFVKKNLRVCGDCHRATKLIAAIRQCTIIVRDANRIHHFHTNGQCSCNDYF
ncbi:unnamed protein product [Rotaria sp. Silwood2]|nr:unnamed protein product [Rotaria sp. Silwood2]CAF4362063.1 unnamed protein product [Rotaria sp. Silwood2]CAF4380666.1 unnamed protein product [Rotaria sp. Silwood2]